MFQFLTTKYGVGQSESELDKLIGFLPFLPTRILSVFWPHNTELEQRVFFSLIFTVYRTTYRQIGVSCVHVHPFSELAVK